jgi:hypothetical protein
MGTIFRIHNKTDKALQLDCVMVYDGQSWQTAAERPHKAVNNKLNDGLYLIDVPGFELKAKANLAIHAIFNTWVLYKVGLASDKAFMLFGVNGSNLHIGLNGEYLMHAGVYGSDPGAVTWTYSPSSPNEEQAINIIKIK